MTARTSLQYRMCGIGGKLSFVGRPDEDLGQAMAATMDHRGPDAEGVYSTGPIVLSHRRLSIIDPSDAGHQPMANQDGSVHIVFNGEIYNYRELRDRVSPYTFRSETDTEVLLHLYEEEGVDCLESLRGMFAFAIWDERKDRLFLARDRLGQKPLYIMQAEDAFWFGSTIKAILADDAVDARPDAEAIREYLTYSFVPHPRTGFDGIERVGPGEYIVLNVDGTSTRDTYWSYSHADQTDASPSVVADRLRGELKEATRLRMRSDVPIGVFLSGGIDSSVTTLLMCEVADADVETYSIGFDADAYDELDFARTVAGALGTAHTEYTVTPNSVSVLPKLVEHFEMPFGDPSAIPTYYVAQVASDDVTVALTGDAGDENFAGYERYKFDQYTSWVRRIPEPIRAGGLKTLQWFPDGQSVERGRRLLRTSMRDPVERYVGYIYIGKESPENYVGKRVWDGPEPQDPLDYLRTAFRQADGPCRLDDLMNVDLRTYLPDDILVKVDRASMAHSVEVRSPFLDHHVVEYAARIPARYKRRRGEGKRILKRAFQDELPDVVLNRSKQGFGVPLDEWFRGELRDLARDRLNQLGERDLFDASAVDSTFGAHIDGTADDGGDLWKLVFLESWFERFIDK